MTAIEQVVVWRGERFTHDLKAEILNSVYLPNSKLLEDIPQESKSTASQPYIADIASRIFALVKNVKLFEVYLQAADHYRNVRLATLVKQSELNYFDLDECRVRFAKLYYKNVVKKLQNCDDIDWKQHKSDMKALVFNVMEVHSDYTSELIESLVSIVKSRLQSITLNNDLFAEDMGVMGETIIELKKIDKREIDNSKKLTLKHEVRSKISKNLYGVELSFEEFKVSFADQISEHEMGLQYYSKYLKKYEEFGFHKTYLNELFPSLRKRIERELRYDGGKKTLDDVVKSVSLKNETFTVRYS